MQQAFKNVFAATLLIGLSFYLWRIANEFGDWAIVALVPLSLVIYRGFWMLALDPWRAKLRIALRIDSPFSRYLTGQLRAALLSIAFTFVAVTLLAWQALVASAFEAAIMLTLVFVAGCVFAGGERHAARHFHQPFARAIAVNIATWVAALPFYLIMAFGTWAYASQPGAVIDATFLEAIQIGIDRMPPRQGWLTEILAVPYGYEAAKLWAVVQLRDHPVVGALFSLDAALVSFVLARTSIVVTQFVQSLSDRGPA